MTRQNLRIDRLEHRDDDPWDVFIADEDERDPEPEPGDFWTDDDLPSTAAGRSDDRRRVRREARRCSH